MGQFKKIGSGWRSKKGTGIMLSIHIDKLKEVIELKPNEKGYISFYVGENMKQEPNRPTHQISVVDNSEEFPAPAFNDEGAGKDLPF